jgi:putative transposase
VYYDFRTWTDDGTWDAINDALRRPVRLDAGKDPDPSVGIIDSQSVKVTAIPGERGYDAGKQVNGRKRSVIVDTLGMVLRVVVHSADLSDLVGGTWVASLVEGVSPRLTKLFGDRHYGGQFAEAMQREYGWDVEVIRRPSDAVGFVVLPKRWVVERTFGWLTWYRRLSKDYEQRVESSESFIYASMIHLMLRRLHPQTTS